MSLENRVALITGAGRGIGRTMAQVLAQKGMWIGINDLDPQTAEISAEDICAARGKALALPGSVTDSGQVAEMIDRIEVEYGPLWLLVNNAGVFTSGATAELPEAAWDTAFEVDAKGVFLCSQAAIRKMIPRKAGRIVNVASIAGMIVRTAQIAYCSAKAAVIHFSRCLSVEMAPYNITVNCLCPGMTWTDMLNTSAQDRGLDLKSMIEMIPAGRMAKEADHAHLVAYLASDEAAHVTGQVISVDGAQSLYHPLIMKH